MPNGMLSFRPQNIASVIVIDAGLLLLIWGGMWAYKKWQTSQNGG